MPKATEKKADSGGLVRATAASGLSKERTTNRSRSQSRERKLRPRTKSEPILETNAEPEGHTHTKTEAQSPASRPKGTLAPRRRLRLKPKLRPQPTPRRGRGVEGPKSSSSPMRCLETAPPEHENSHDVFEDARHRGPWKPCPPNSYSQDPCQVERMQCIRFKLLYVLRCDR